MAGKSIQDLLYYENLIGTVQQVIGGVPEDILPAGFLNATDSVSGKTGTYTRVQGTRETARTVLYGSPSRKREMSGVSEVPVTLLHTFEHLDIDPTVLMQLRDEGSPIRQEMGRQTIARNLADFGQRFRNLRVSCVYSAFKYGAIYFDGNGNLLPTSSGAVYTVDYGIPSGNKDQLNWDGNGAIIGASWGTAGTDVIGDIRAIKKAARIKTGYPIRHAFYGQNILGYLLGNTAIAKLIASSFNLSEAVANAPSEVPQGLLGLQWHPIDEAFYVDSTATTRSWFSGDEIIFTPDPSPDWWGFIQGTFPVPTTLDIAGDGMAAISSLQEVLGPFSYAKVTDDPPSIRHFAGDTFLPVIKNPWAVYLADVTP